MINHAVTFTIPTPPRAQRRNPSRARLRKRYNYTAIRGYRNPMIHVGGGGGVSSAHFLALFISARRASA